MYQSLSYLSRRHHSAIERRTVRSIIKKRATARESIAQFFALAASLRSHLLLLTALHNKYSIQYQH